MNNIKSFEDFFNFSDIKSLKKEFSENNFVYIENVLKDDALLYLQNKINMLKSSSTRKEFLMPETEYSPRKMNIINGNVMNKQTDIFSLYSNDKLLNTLSEITSNKVSLCEEKIENIIVSHLNKKADTHGWHLDDFPFAFILGIDMPNEKDGGAIEFEIPNSENKKVFLKSGDAYILRTDIVNHRVTPLLKENVERIILNFTYSIDGHKISPNGSAYKLCSDSDYITDLQ